MNPPELSWDTEGRLDGVYRRGRQLRRRNLSARLASASALVAALVVGAMWVDAGRDPSGPQVQTASGPPVPSATAVVDAQEPSTAPDSAGFGSGEAVTTTPTSGSALASPAAEAPGQPVSSQSPPPTNAPPVRPTAPADPAPVTITATEADENATYALRPGDRLVVRLSGASGDYTLPRSSDEGVLAQTSGSNHPDRGAEASFLAVGEGRATVKYSWEAKCRKATPACMLPSQQYSLSIAVAG